MYLGWTALFVMTPFALVQPVVAKSASEVEQIAKASTVSIKLQNTERVGSGVIIHRQGNLYTLVTNRHVICGTPNCSNVPKTEVYNLNTANGQKYQATQATIKLLGNEVDLAIVQFRSDRPYPVVKIASGPKATDTVFTAGFPLEGQQFTFGEGNVIAAVNKRIQGDKGGYSIIYDAFTLPGMSGGGVFNSNGELVAIHGIGDRYTAGTEVESDWRIGNKLGFNRGIPVRWLLQGLGNLGININRTNLSEISSAKPTAPTQADEYFIAGFNKFVDPGEQVRLGKKQALQYFTKAIQLNTRYTYAYLLRGLVYLQTQEFKLSLADFDQAIALNPKYAEAYNNRGYLKREALNDISGALADYDQAIVLNPNNADTYNNRALLKHENLNDLAGAMRDYDMAIRLKPKNADMYFNRANLKSDMNDFQGALADFNQSILINPKDARAYSNRGFLKFNNLNDTPGALADYDQAIAIDSKLAGVYYNRAVLKKKSNDRIGAIQDFQKSIQLYQQEGNTEYVQRATKHLQELGVTN
jgi:tetratricopeptide (TPR) repeat protein/V8-like Glu-specific endopeptidase